MQHTYHRTVVAVGQLSIILDKGYTINMTKSKKPLTDTNHDDNDQWFVDNLNHNVKLDHIDYVDHGVRPVDKDYRIFKEEFIKKWGIKKYEQESLQREDRIEKLYGTDWKSKRISI